MTLERFPIERARKPGPAEPRDIGLQHAACRSLLLLGGCFTDERYAWAFQALVNLYLADLRIDLITLAEELRRLGKFQAVGGAEFVASLAKEFAL